MSPVFLCVSFLFWCISCFSLKRCFVECFSLFSFVFFLPFASSLASVFLFDSFFMFLDFACGLSVCCRWLGQECICRAFYPHVRSIFTGFKQYHFSLCCVEPLRTAAPFWGQSSQIPSMQFAPKNGTAARKGSRVVCCLWYNITGDHS